MWAFRMTGKHNPAFCVILPSGEPKPFMHTLHGWHRLVTEPTQKDGDADDIKYSLDSLHHKVCRRYRPPTSFDIMDIVYTTSKAQLKRSVYVGMRIGGSNVNITNTTSLYQNMMRCKIMQHKRGTK